MSVVITGGRIVDRSGERSGDVPVDTLGIRREDRDDAVIFRLN